MLLDCYHVNDEGEATKTEANDLKLTHSTVAIIVSHTHHCIYVFKGKDISIVQKFSSARTASQMRLQQGYKIKHIEETEGIDDEFIPIMDFLGGLHNSEPTQPKKVIEEPARLTQKPPMKEENVKTLPKKEIATPPKIAEPKPQLDLTRFKENYPAKIVKVLETVTALDPPQGSECDYLLIANSLYLLTGKNKKDLRDGEFDLEEVTVLPEGVFPAENYYPRILVVKKKVVGVEFWVRR
ncbi:MAG: hypothetical protein ACFFDW_01765 [Candidatus Thorarchaeota archaeon]